MKNILITGGAGNIGSSLADELSQRDMYNITIVDNLSTGKLEKIPIRDNINFIKADANSFNDMMSIMNSERFDYVFHYAAIVGVRRTLENPISVLNDINGIRNILTLSKNSGVKRFFYSSSSEVYGEPFEHPQNENTTPLNSRLPYAIVKNVGEAYCRSMHLEHHLDYNIFRFFNTFGPNQSEDFVLPKFLKSALRNEDITIYGLGQQTRTFCYISDNINATLKVLDNEKYSNQTFNLGSDFEINILDLAKLIIKITNSKSKLIFLPELKEGDMTRRRPDNKKMKNLLNKELITLEEGILKLINSYESSFKKE